MSLFPYRYAAAQEAAKTGMPIMRALALLYQDDARARAAKDEYLFGPDFLVAPVIDEGTQRTVYLPAGEWVDYWTGAEVAGGKVVVADAPLDTIPVWARAGAVIAKIPEDVMTLVPQSESGNTTVKSLDDRRVYEVIGGWLSETRITDFEGRVVVRAGEVAEDLRRPGGAGDCALAVWGGDEREGEWGCGAGAGGSGRAVGGVRPRGGESGGVGVGTVVSGQLAVGSCKAGGGG